MTDVAGAFCVVPFLTGCGTSAALIMAIGAQNAFVLKQGLMRNHVFVTAMFCALADALLIGLGVHGFGAILMQNELFMNLAKWGGALFLFIYGFISFYNVGKVGRVNMYMLQDKPTLYMTLITLTAVTFLNPHAYLDTVVFLGSIASQFPHTEKMYFTMGAVTISFLWFFGVSYGARYLDKYFKSDAAWRILDFMIGVIMWGIAVSIILPSGCLCF